MSFPESPNEQLSKLNQSNKNYKQELNTKTALEFTSF